MTDGKRPDERALAAFFRSLSVMFAASVSLVRAFQLLARQSECPHLRRLADDVARRLQAGSSLSRAMEQHGEAFSTIQVRLVQIGEKTGTLDGVLARLADYEEAGRRTRMKIRGALTYPAFIFLTASTLLVILPPYMFSGLFQMIRASGVPPPLITRLVMGLSDVVRTPVFWLLFAGLAVAATLLAPKLTRQREVRSFGQRLALRLPGMGRLVRLVAVARFARAMSICLQAGENLLAGVNLAARSTECLPLIDELPTLLTRLREDGLSLAEALQATGFFPDSFLHMLTAGQEAGRPAEMMERMADVYESEVDYALDALTALLEPAVMLCMGVLVGIIVVATMLPMLAMLQHL